MNLMSSTKRVFLNEIESTDDTHFVVATDGLFTCVSALINTDDTSYMMHIELLDGIDNSKSFELYKNLIDALKDKQRKVYLFKGFYTKEEDIERLLEI